jgi:LuxR family maltose regulon positive regulatory protein
MSTVRARDSASLTGAPRPGNHVARPRVVRLLARALDAPLTLVDAPTGYGKTTAVRDFLAAGALPRPAAFVTLTPSDDAVAAFWDRVLVHMRAAWPEIDLDLDVGPPGAGDARRVVPLLHARTDGVEGPRVVVLDDLHHLRDPAVLGDLAHLVDRLPPALRLVATTRRTPALPVGRWRAQGRIAELTMDDLRFRADEVAALLERSGAGAEADVRALTDRSEGWAAGLALLAGLPDPRAPLDPGPAGELLDEVLDDHPVDVREFLLTTSLLGRFTADLCRVVTGRPDTGAVLHDLQGANLFLVALDDEGDWFRYQRLFAEMLRDRVERHTTSARHVERQKAIHRRAAAWFEADGKPADAVAHHVRAGDADRALGLLGGDVDLFARGRHVSGIDWEGLFPSAWLEQDPQRMIWFAALLAPAGGVDRMPYWLDRAEAMLDAEARAGTGVDAAGHGAHGAHGARSDPRQGLLAAVRTYHHALRYDASRAIECGQQALGLLDDPATAEVMGRRVLISLVTAHILIDELDAADGICARLDAPDVPDVVRSLVVPGFRARLALRRGQLGQAEGLARLVRRAARAMGFPFHVGVRDANLALGGVLAERGEADEAARLFDEAIEQAEGRGWVPSAIVTCVERVRLDAGRDGPIAGLAGVDRLRQTIAAHTVGPDAVAAVDALEARFCIAATALASSQGGGGTGSSLGTGTGTGSSLGTGTGAGSTSATARLDRAARLIDGLRPGIGRRLLEVRWSLAAGDADRARALLGGAVAGNLRDRLVVDLLHARLAAATGDAGDRDRRVRAAADRARSQGFRRIFLDEAPELVPVLHALADEHGELRPLSDEVATVAADSGLGRGEPLTERELSVLRYLQSQLTHHEIASQLGISTNTLKTHTRALYRKLGATSRTEAVTAALRSGLL